MYAYMINTYDSRKQNIAVIKWNFISWRPGLAQISWYIYELQLHFSPGRKYPALFCYIVSY